jgi:hypothetical protein
VNGLDADFKHGPGAAKQWSDEYCAAHKNPLDPAGRRRYIAGVAAMQQNVPTGLRNPRAASQGPNR